MAGISLATAQKHLDAWLQAELKVSEGQSYQIGSRQLQRADLGDIRKQVQYWERKVNLLDSVQKRGGKRRVIRVMPRDL